MKKSRTTFTDAEILRKKAEDLYLLRPPKTGPPPTDFEILKLIHELEVYQIELDLQKEELERTYSEANDAISLYDLAPVGYYTLTRDATIIRVNYEGMRILGKDIPGLIDSSFYNYIDEDSKFVFSLFLDQIFNQQIKGSCDIALSDRNTKHFLFHLTGNISENDKHCIVAAVDITERKQAENAATALASRNQVILQTAGDGIHILDEQGYVIETNDAFCSMLGYSRDELMQLNVADWDIQWKPEELVRKIHEFINNPATFETLHQCKDGRLIDVEIRCSGLNLEGRNYLCASARDITARKQAEKEFKEIHSLTEATLESIHNGIIAIDSRGRIVSYNARFASMWHIPQHILSTGNDKILLDYIIGQVSDPAEFKTKVEELYSKPEAEILDRICFNDGRIFERFSRPMFIENKPEGRVWSFLDITESKKAEEAVAQTRQNFETFFNTIDDLLFVLDVKGNIIHSNKTVTDRLGYTQEELKGKSVLMVHPPERREEAGRIVAEMLEGKTECCPVPVQTKSGVQIPVETRVSIGIWDGKPVIFGVTKDISQLRLSEEKYAKLFLNNHSACGLDELETGKYIEVNDSFYNLFGFTREEVIGKSALELGILTPETANELLKKVGEDDKISNVEISLKTKNGDIKQVLLSGENIHIQDKRYRYTIVHDITERKLIEKELVNSKKLFELFFSQSYMGFYFMMIDEPFVWDSGIDKEKTIETVFNDMKFTKVNQAFLDQYHATETDFIGKNLNDQFVKNPEHGRKVWTDFLNKGKKIRMETHETTMDGKPITVEGDYTCMYDEEGMIFGIFGVQLDITASKKAADDLIESEANLNAIFNATEESVLLLASDNTILAINKVAARRMESSREMLIGQKVDEVLLPNIVQNRQPFIAKAISTGEPVSFEDDRNGHWMSNNLYPILNSSGQVVRMAIFSGDITSRKQAEEALKESEVKYKSLYESANDAIFILDGSTFTDCNQKTEILFKCNKKDILAHTVLEFSPDVQPDGMPSTIKATKKIEAALTGTPQFFEWRHRRLDGTLFDAEVSLSRVELKGITTLQAIVRDISERKLALEALKESELRYKSLFETSPSGVIVTDETGTILEANLAILKTINYTQNELVGSNLADIAMPDQTELIADNLKRLLAGEVLEHEIQAKRKDGTSCYLFVKVACFTMPNGKRGILSVSNDITDRKQAEIELAKSEERLREINKTDWVWEINEKGEFTYTSQTGIEFLGLSGIDEIIGKTPFDFMPPDERERVSAIFSQIATNKLPIRNLENWNIRKNGEKSCLLTNGLPILDDTGNLIGYRGVDKDITDRKKAEEALQVSESRFRNIADTAPVMIWMTGTDAKCTYVNKPWLDFSGRSMEEETGNGWAKGIHPDDFQLCTDIFQEAFKTQSNYTMEYRLRRADSEYRWLLENGVPWFAMDGNFLGFIGSCVDITEGKQAIEKLKQSEAKFRDLFEANTDGITIFPLLTDGPPSAIIDLNENAAKMLGYSKQEMLLQSPDRIEIQQTKEHLEKRINELKHKGHTTFETRLLHKDGHEIDAEVKVLVVNYVDQTMLMNISRDISERKKSEIQLENYAKELSKQVAEKDKFFSIIAHDLRGPLGGFMGLSERMAEGMKEMTLDELQNIAGVMRSSSSNIFSLLGNLLEWSRMQRGLTAFEPVSLALLPVIHDTLTLMLASANNKNITVNVPISENITVFADANMLASIIRNLVANSVKFTPKGGNITIEATPDPSMFIMISVSDTGIGMDKTMIENLFNLNVNTGRKGTDGELSTGLGLMLCKEFVEKHGGELKIVSEVDKGSTFSFTLQEGNK